jgi:glycosyltransferase involved in cell wall biosynthesis
MTRRTSVVLLLPSLHGGGAERVMVHIANHLDRGRYEPSVVLGAVEGPYLRDVRPDVPIHGLGGATRARTAVPSVVRALRRLRPDVVLSTVGSNFAVALARPFLPRRLGVIFREGNSTSAFLADVARTSPGRAAVYRAIYRALYARADRVVCQSDFMLNDLATRFRVPRARLTRIHNPVDVDAIRARLTEPVVYAGRGPHLVTAGKLEHQKGYDLLIAAFARVLASHPAATLTLVGEGTEHAALEAAATSLGIASAVRFLGFQPNPFPYFAAADLFVSSSRYEGFANVITEAMACGTPVVATDCPGASREVIEPGVTGWLARSEDVDALAEAMTTAIAALPGVDRKAIELACERRFSVTRIAAAYEAEIDRCAA